MKWDCIKYDQFQITYLNVFIITNLIDSIYFDKFMEAY